MAFVAGVIDRFVVVGLCPGLQEQLGDGGVVVAPAGHVEHREEPVAGAGPGEGGVHAGAASISRRARRSWPAASFSDSRYMREPAT